MRTRVVCRSLVLGIVVLVRCVSLAAAQAPSRIVVRNPTNASHEFFGRAATGVGSTIVVGAPGRSALTITPEGPPGRVDVLDAATGAVIRSIQNPTPADGDGFGISVANLGGNVLVGAPLDDTAASNAGAAYLFDGGTGALLRTFTLPGAVADQRCGDSVAALGSNVLLGCVDDAAYLLDATTGAVLQTYDIPLEIGFPFAVESIGGDALGYTPLGGVSRFDGATGMLVRTYDPTTPNQFVVGFAVLGSNVLVAAAQPEAVLLFDGPTGALLHTFVEPVVTWTSNYFGSGLAVNGDRIAIGAQGAVYLFDATTYAQVDTVLPIESFRSVGAYVAAHTSGFVVQDWPVGAPATGGVQILDLCGNGFVANSESCDDGNRNDGDGCSSRCRLEPCGAAPAAGCFTTSTGRSRLELFEEYSLYGEKDRLKWKWLGTGGTPANFGDPTTTAASTLCLWDRGNTVPRLLVDLDAPAGRTCQGKPCWDARGSAGFRRIDRSNNPDGLGRVDLRAGSSMVLSMVGLGPTLGLPEPSYDGPFPFQGTVVAQLHNSDTGACWEARYSSASTNDHRKYRATND